MIPVSLSWGKLADGFCWQNPEQYKEAIFALLVAQVGGSFNGLIISQNTPATTDRDKLWLRTDAFGRPVSFYLFQGQWLWPNNSEPSGNERRVWVGSEAAAWSYDGGDGNDPSVITPTPVSGAMWQVDHNFDYRFLIGAGTNGTTYNGNPASSVSVGAAGGEEQHVLSADEDPEHQHVFGQTDNPAADRTALLKGSSQTITSTPTDETVAINPSVSTDVTAGDLITSKRVLSAVASKSHQNMPPYRGAFYLKRTVRQFYTAS